MEKKFQLVLNAKHRPADFSYLQDYSINKIKKVTTKAKEYYILHIIKFIIFKSEINRAPQKIFCYLHTNKK